VGAIAMAALSYVVNKYILKKSKKKSIGTDYNYQ
jgi:hypothetical protein